MQGTQRLLSLWLEISGLLQRDPGAEPRWLMGLGQGRSKKFLSPGGGGWPSSIPPLFLRASLLFTLSLEVGPLKSSYIEGLGSAVSSPAGSGAEPQPKPNLVHFSLKIRHLVTTILIIFLWINWTNIVHAVFITIKPGKQGRRNKFKSEGLKKYASEASRKNW